MNRKQLLALSLVSVWIAWTPAMWFVATGSFRAASRALARPQPGFLQLIRPGSSRAVLMGFAGFVNGRYFLGYGIAQIVLGILVLIVLWRLAPEERVVLVLTAVMLAIVVGLAVFVAPQINRLAAIVNLNPSSPVAPHFWSLHGIYTGLDGAKLILGLVILGKWLALPRRG
jgi:hypothetical protein